uniref:SDR family oxidoreductase n=1 Tax=Castellaniella defragrans TaxID=75697 RepID=UPI00333F22CC
MKVLVCGASGFVGRAIADRLARDGHQVVRGVRRPASPAEIAIDYMADLSAEQWLARLEGIDAVVNAVGILVERGGQTFECLHAQAPIALFAACRQRDVRRVIQISALGADSRETPYFASKCAADDFLLAQALPAHVIRPSLVYGHDGDSASFFRVMASLPIHPLPAGGRQALRPIHVDDLSGLVSRLLDAGDDADHPACIEAVGGTPVSYREMLGLYRKGMGLPAAIPVGIPAWVMRGTAAIGGWIPSSTLTPETWRMLRRGNTADARQTASVLGKAPRGIETFIEPAAAPALRAEAVAAWQPMMLRLALAVVWIMSAIVSLALYPRAASFALLERFNLQGIAAGFAFYGACALDFGLGIATLIKPGRRLWLIQMAVVLIYSALIAIVLPEFLIDPFGPILKNIPILALLIVLLNEEPQP